MEEGAEASPPALPLLVVAVVAVAGDPVSAPTPCLASEEEGLAVVAMELVDLVAGVCTT